MESTPTWKPTPGQPTVVAGPSEHVSSKLVNRQAIWMGSVQVFGGVDWIFFGTDQTGIQIEDAYFDVGIWCRILLVVTGAFGITAGMQKKIYPWYVVYFALSIVGALLSGILIIQSIVCIWNDHYRKRITNDCPVRRSSNGECIIPYDVYNTGMSLDSTALFHGILDAGLFMLTSALSRKIVFGRRAQAGQTMVLPTGMLPVVQGGQQIVGTDQIQPPDMYATSPSTHLQLLQDQAEPEYQQGFSRDEQKQVLVQK